MWKIRNATSNECDLLTQLAINSEAYWGYDAEYMNHFKSVYGISADFIRNNLTILIEEHKNLIGFYALIAENDKTCLEYFFINPLYIGQGYGKILWNHLIEKCKKLNVKTFELVTSPQAKAFYIKMGALDDGEVESVLKKGRMIPKLIYILVS